MALYRQGSQPWQAAGQDVLTNGGDPRSLTRAHDHGRLEQLQRSHSSLARTRSWKFKRLGRPASRNGQLPLFIFMLLLSAAAFVTLYCADDVFEVVRNLRGTDLFSGLPGSDDVDKQQIYDLSGRRLGDGNLQQITVLNSHLEMEEEDGQDRVSSSKKKKKRTSCEINFAHTASGVQEPKDMSAFNSFQLKYIQIEEKPENNSIWKPKFAGHQSLVEREQSYLAGDQILHCGFVEGPEGYPDTGFELSRDDSDYLRTCHIAVSSCVFGNYDHVRNPPFKKVSKSSKETVCFAMFVDQESLDGMIEEGEVPDKNMNIGFWRVVLIRTLPYSDNRRTGKIPKFLTHRLFPNAKYSIWLDSKLRLQNDPLLILDYFLWQGHHEYAISNHYDRHCVWEEVAQNKKLNKFNHSRIDEQFEFYQKDGLTRFNGSDPHKILPSHVPEGSFIVRAHTPMSNLFSCLWFNEVERFTSRDQLSFAYTFLKFVRMNPSKNFQFNMFKDCERREMVKLYHHKQEEISKQ